MCPEEEVSGNVSPDDSDTPRQDHADVRAFEATLATLAARQDRLDPGLIMFRAGQRSVLRGQSGPSWLRSRFWPAATAAMTAVAAGLLVMLARQSAPVTHDHSHSAEVAVTGKHDASQSRPATGSGRRSESSDVASTPARERQSDDSPAASTRSPQRRSFWTAMDPPDLQSPRAVRLQRVHRLLAQGIDPWAQPLLRGDRETAPQPLPYRQLLQGVLNNPSGAAWPDDRPDSSLDSGENS